MSKIAGPITSPSSRVVSGWAFVNEGKNGHYLSFKFKRRFKRSESADWEEESFSVNGGGELTALCEVVTEAMRRTQFVEDEKARKRVEERKTSKAGGDDDIPF